MEKRNILVIVIAWSLLIYVGYNVLTVEATVEEKLTPKEICKVYDTGKWDDDSSKCEFSKQGIKDEDYVDFDHYIADEGLADEYLAEIAAKEDAICDDEDADTTDIKTCMSASRQQQAAHNYDKESCEEVNGDWNKKKGSGCTFYEDEQQDILDAAEEQRKIIDEEEQKQLQEIADYNAAQAQTQQEEEVIEDWGNTVKTEEEQARDKVIKIVEESEEGNEVHGNAEIDYTTDSSDNESSNDEEQEQDEPAEQEEESNDDNESEESSDSNNEESE